MKVNADLVGNQYYASVPVYGLYYPKAILKLKPIR